MCRLAAYMGPPRPLADVIIAPDHSLVVQSHDAQEAKLSVNGDGFGVAWYDRNPNPGLYKNILPAWSDDNLLSLCQHISAPLFLSHVRASTEGETARANCHPFTHENWSFMHNGQTGSFSRLRRQLEATLPDDLYELRRGTTDSELLFLLVLNAGLSSDPARACSKVISLLKATAMVANVVPFFRMTCVFSDGTNLYGFRYASDHRYPTLYSSRCFIDGGLVIASEPMGGVAKGWDAFVPNQLVRFGPDVDQSSFDLLAA